VEKEKKNHVILCYLSFMHQEEKEKTKYMLQHPKTQKQLTTFGRKKIYSPEIDIR